MEIRAARASERDEVLDLLAHWYGDRNFFARYNHHDPAFRDELCLVADDAGRIVATAQIFDRRVNFAGQTVPMGGIGSVYTREDWRRRGAASALMRLALDTLVREGFEVSLLFTDRLDFYATFGWRPVNRTFTAVMGAEQARASADPNAIDIFVPARDLETVREIHAAYSGRRDACEIRDPARWRANLIYAGNPREHFVVAHDRAGAAAAYARAILMEGYPIVMEHGYRPDQSEAMIALVAHLGRIVAGADLATAPERLGGEVLRSPDARGGGLLVMHSRHDPALEERLKSSGCHLMHHEENHYMWRLIAADRFAARFGIAPAEADERLFAMVGAPDALFWTADRF